MNGIRQKINVDHNLKYFRQSVRLHIKTFEPDKKIDEYTDQEQRIIAQALKTTCQSIKRDYESTTRKRRSALIQDQEKARQFLKEWKAKVPHDVLDTPINQWTSEQWVYALSKAWSAISSVTQRMKKSGATSIEREQTVQENEVVSPPVETRERSASAPPTMNQFLELLQQQNVKLVESFVEAMAKTFDPLIKSVVQQQQQHSEPIEEPAVELFTESHTLELAAPEIEIDSFADFEAITINEDSNKRIEPDEPEPERPPKRVRRPARTTDKVLGNGKKEINPEFIKDAWEFYGKHATGKIGMKPLSQKYAKHTSNPDEAEKYEATLQSLWRFSVPGAIQVTYEYLKSSDNPILKKRFDLLSKHWRLDEDGNVEYVG